MFARRKGVREERLHFVRFLWPRFLRKFFNVLLKVLRRICLFWVRCSRIRSVKLYISKCFFWSQLEHADYPLCK